MPHPPKKSHYVSVLHSDEMYDANANDSDGGVTDGCQICQSVDVAGLNLTMGQCYGDETDDACVDDCDGDVNDGCQIRHSVHIAAKVYCVSVLWWSNW